jgi:nicotinate-nucleotide adenylyltransferase
MEIGLFFGSFNPVHTGHLIVADYILENTAIQKVWFVVSPQNPFKKNNVLKYSERIKMVEIATKENKKLKVTDIEAQLPLPSYTINTLDKLKEKYPHHKFSIIMGSDNMVAFKKWKDYKRILNNYKIYVYRRSGKNIPIRHKNIIRLNSPVIEISSTEIRKLIQAKKPVKYYLPEIVYKYITSKKFYLT